MRQNFKDKWNIVLITTILIGLFVLGLFSKDQEISMSERRKLHQLPKLTMESVFEKKGDSSFMNAFEVYAKDQFPFRESFRKLHAISGRYLLGRKEINQFYSSDGHLSKMEDGIHEKDLDWAVDRMQYVLNQYVNLDQANVYLCVIPDKNYYLAPAAGYPYVDVEEVMSYVEARLPEEVHSIKIVDKLEKEDYYHTDTHWKQEKIVDIAEELLCNMGRIGDGKEVEEFDKAEVKKGLERREYTVKSIEMNFYGVYYGQAALPVPPDSLQYLTWDGMEQLNVTCYDTGSPVKMNLYDEKKVEGFDPYEYFLSGSKALITIENPEAKNGELVLFRDSFGSSMAPLLTEGYHKITLVDIRYITPAMVGKFVDFTDADVLFLYSSSVLNNSIGQFIK